MVPVVGLGVVAGDEVHPVRPHGLPVALQHNITPLYLSSPPLARHAAVNGQPFTINGHLINIVSLSSKSIIDSFNRDSEV